MKKLFFSVLLIMPFLVGCDALGELTKIPLPFEQTITIPAIPIVGVTTQIETPDIETGIDSVLKATGISSDVVEEVLLSKMELALTGSGDLSFLDNVTVYITADNKEPVKIASATGIKDVNSVKFTVEKADIKKFIMGDKFKLKIDIKTDKVLLEPKDVNLKMEFIIDLKVLGL